MNDRHPNFTHLNQAPFDATRTGMSFFRRGAKFWRSMTNKRLTDDVSLPYLAHNSSSGSSGTDDLQDSSYPVNVLTYEILWTNLLSWIILLETNVWNYESTTGDAQRHWWLSQKDHDKAVNKATTKYFPSIPTQLSNNKMATFRAIMQTKLSNPQWLVDNKYILCLWWMESQLSHPLYPIFLQRL